MSSSSRYTTRRVWATNALGSDARNISPSPTPKANGAAASGAEQLGGSVGQHHADGKGADQPTASPASGRRPASPS